MRLKFLALTILLSSFASAQSGPFVISSASSVCASIQVGSNQTTVGIDVEGTFSLTLQPEVSLSGRAPANSQVVPSTSTTLQSTITATGYFQANVAGYSQFQLCPTSYVSGSATIYLFPSSGVSASGSSGSGGAVTQSGTWNVRTQDGAGNALTSNSTVTAAKFALDFNILSILGTAPTTAGFLDIKGADGNIFVRQATGTNLHAVLDAGSIEGVDMTGTVPGTAPANTRIMGGIFNTANPVPTTGQTLPFQLNSQGDLNVGSRPIANSGTASLSQVNESALTSSVNVKATPGSLYGFSILNGAATTCFLQFINTSGAGTLGTTPLFSMPLFLNASGPTQFIFPFPIQFSTGIAVGISTTYNGATPCGTAGVGEILYK